MITALKSGSPGVGPLETKLSSFVRLEPRELADVRARLSDPRQHLVREDVLDGEGEAVRLVVSGWAGVTRILSDGRRQILRIALPGDFVSRPPLLETTVVALTPCRSFDAWPLLDFAEREPRQARGLHEALACAQTDLRRDLLNQVVRLGSLTAYERTANLLVELIRRHQRAGLTDGRRMPWPITQEILADILGLSIVHVNRVLQQLRRDKLIEISAGMLVACDLERLARSGLLDAEAEAGPANDDVIGHEPPRVAPVSP